MTSRLLCLVVLLSAACGDARPSSAPAALTGPPVEVWLNGEKLGVLSATAIVARQDYRGLLPAKARDAASWQRLRVSSPQKAALSIPAPATRYRDHEFRLFVDKGVAAFGIFRPVPTGAPAQVIEQAQTPSLFVSQANKIEIWTHDPAPEHVELTVMVRAGQVEKKLSARELSVIDNMELLARDPSGTQHPGISNRAATKATGWRLSDVFASAKLHPGARVLVTAADQQPTLVDPNHSTLNTNRRGAFSVYFLDDADNLQRIRNVVSIAATPARPAL